MALSHPYNNVPLLLTITRLAISPLVLPILIVWLWPMHVTWFHALLGGIFAAFALTDLLDGFFARLLKQETLLGKLLDPLADKSLTIASLIALQAAGALWYLWVIVLVLREVFVTGLRYIAQEHGVTVHVSWWGKSKTWLQMVLITFVLSAYPFMSYWWFVLGTHLLLFACIAVSWYSAYRYYQVCINKVVGRHDF